MNGIDGRIFYVVGFCLIGTFILSLNEVVAGGVFCCLIGIVSGIGGYVYFLKQNKLVRTGQKISAKSLGLAEYGRMMGFTRYRVICEWIDPETNKSQLFMSRAFKEDELKYYVPTEYVNVYLNKDTGDYYVDALSFNRT